MLIRIFRRGYSTAQKLGGSFPVMVFGPSGESAEKSYTKHTLLKDTHLNARDLIVLDSGFHRRPRPSILVRKEAFIVCMAHIRTIVRKDAVYLFHVHDMDVQYFATRFSQYLKGKRSPFLPPVFLGTHASELDSEVNTTPHDTTEMKDLPFECKALEGILSHVCRQYYNRAMLVSPLVKNLLDALSARKIDPETLHKLLPMKNVLSQFEIETTLMRNSLHEVLQSDEDMLMMLLTERAEKGDAIPIERHEMVELLLENYCSQMVDISQEAYYLRKRIESTQGIIELKLDTYRNHMLRINMQLAMSSIAIACSTALSGVFGMNLVSGLEQHPQMFYWVCLGSGTGMLSIFALLNISLSRSFPSTLSVPNKKSLFNYLREIQFILGYARATPNKSELSREQFARLLKDISDVDIDKEELEIIFKTFDLDNNGTISGTELKRQHSMREIGSAFSRLPNN